jgi:hypothetical protein
MPGRARNRAVVVTPQSALVKPSIGNSLMQIMRSKSELPFAPTTGLPGASKQTAVLTLRERGWWQRREYQTDMK